MFFPRGKLLEIVETTYSHLPPQYCGGEQPPQGEEFCLQTLLICLPTELQDYTILECNFLT